jgi:hypothetical protein
MKHAAIGVRMHSGWGVLVSVSGDAAAPEVVDRKRIVITDPTMAGANQPYHFVEKLGLQDAEKHLQDCAAVSERLALAAIRDTLEAMHARNYRVVGSAMLLALGRALPPLSGILASHALVHAAEGEFFRKIVQEACERLRIRVTGFRERELDERAKAMFGNAAARVQQRISNLGSSVGPPWTKDEKTAAFAALMLLGDRTH